MEYQQYLKQIKTLEERRNQINKSLRTKRVEEVTAEVELLELIASTEDVLRLAPSVPSEFADDYSSRVDQFRRNIYYFNTLIEELKGRRSSV